MFLYWIISAGPKWLRRIVKEELAVSLAVFDVQKYSEAFLHVVTRLLLSTFDVQKYSEAFLHVVTCLRTGTLGFPVNAKMP
jgi:hypothetical protein